jgi:carboxyl-terminal processing protease
MKQAKHENWMYLRQKNTAQIILDEVEIKSVVFFSKIDAKTGYIVLAHFNKKSYETKALEELKRQGAERIILDLRGNPEACSMKR